MHPSDTETVVGLCTAELIAPLYVVTAGHCAERLLKNEPVKVHVTWENVGEGVEKVERKAIRCTRSPTSEDVAVCELLSKVGSNVKPAILNPNVYKSKHHATLPVYCAGTYDGFHFTGPKKLEYEDSGAHLYVSNKNGSGMHAGDSGGGWVQLKNVTSSKDPMKHWEIKSLLVGVIHGGTGTRGIAGQLSSIREFIDKTTNGTVVWES
jgi:hypothetical protein